MAGYTNEPTLAELPAVGTTLMIKAIATKKAAAPKTDRTLWVLMYTPPLSGIFFLTFDGAHCTPIFPARDVVKMTFIWNARNGLRASGNG